MIKNFSEQDNSRRSDNDSSINPNLTYLVLISPIAGFIGVSIISARYYLHDKKITDIRQRINVLSHDLTSQDDASNIEKLSEICEDIKEKKLGNYLFTSLVNGLMRITPENSDIINQSLDKAIPKTHEIEISNLNPNYHKSLRKTLLNLILARDSNFDQSKYSPENQELLLKAQRLFANKSNKDFLDSVIDSFDQDRFSTKDLFLIYALSNSKDFIEPSILSRLVHDTYCRAGLIQIIRGGVGLDTNRNFTIEPSNPQFNVNSGQQNQVTAQLTGSEARPEILSRLFVIGDQNQETNSQSNAGASVQSDRAIVHSSAPPQRVIFVNLYQVNSSSNDSNRGVIPI